MPALHPLVSDLHDLKEDDLETRIRDLNKKYMVAHRFGNPEVLTQLITLINIYKEELSSRYRKKFDDNPDNELDQLINVD